ncbi:hypothetical protein ACLB2K_055965 [Fragaria x ananassa]
MYSSLSPPGSVKMILALLALAQADPCTYKFHFDRCSSGSLVRLVGLSVPETLLLTSIGYPSIPVISAMKSATGYPFMAVLGLNSMSNSLSSMAHLLNRPKCFGHCSTCFNAWLVGQDMNCVSLEVLAQSASGQP